jgi:hypothetical protein
MSWCRLQVLLLSKLLGGAVRVGALWCLEVGLLQAIMLALPTPSIAALAHTCKVHSSKGVEGLKGWRLRGLCCVVCGVVVGVWIGVGGGGRVGPAAAPRWAPQ